MKRFLPQLTIAVSLALAPSSVAQNVSGYGMMPDPFLFLVREPAVHEDLGLTREQIGRLTETNQRVKTVLRRGAHPVQQHKRIK